MVGHVRDRGPPAMARRPFGQKVGLASERGPSAMARRPFGQKVGHARRRGPPSVAQRPKQAKVGRIVDHRIIWHKRPKGRNHWSSWAKDRRSHERSRTTSYGTKADVVRYEVVVMGRRLEPCHLGQSVRAVSSWASSPVNSGKREVTSIADHQ